MLSVENGNQMTFDAIFLHCSYLVTTINENVVFWVLAPSLNNNEDVMCLASQLCDGVAFHLTKHG